MEVPERLGRQVVSELRKLNESGNPEITADIDLVWVFSAPGTIDRPPHQGPYKNIYAGRLPDLERVNKGIEIVREVTSKRIGKMVDGITKDDVGNAGPILFYNGEDKSNQDALYFQNEAMEKLISAPSFPIPKSHTYIQHIEETNTSGQIKAMAEFLKVAQHVKKIALISHAPHMMRVLRYLEKYKDLYSKDIHFVPITIPETSHTVAITKGEIRRIEAYEKKGDLSKNPIDI